MENNLKFPFTILPNLTSWNWDVFFKHREIRTQWPKVRKSGKTPNESGYLEPLQIICKNILEEKNTIIVLSYVHENSLYLLCVMLCT